MVFSARKYIHVPHLPNFDDYIWGINVCLEKGQVKIKVSIKPDINTLQV